jgi:hypothetical protein
MTSRTLQSPRLLEFFRCRPRIAAGIGACAGAALAAAVAPLTRGWFSVPTGGVGIVTITHYPKNYDYAVIALLIAGSAIGAWLLSRTCAWRTAAPGCPGPPKRLSSTFIALVIFVVMLFVHDHPYALMDPFHEGEHLTPAFLLRAGERAYGDIFILHGLAVDGGLDALVLGHPPSVKRTRRLETILDAAILALLAPLASELCATTAGGAVAVLIALCAIGAGQVPVFPYFRFAPLFGAALALLRYARSGGGLFLAFAASTLGILWSLDTGLYALAATAICTVLLRPAWKPVVVPAVIALALPIAILLAIRADLHRFIADSFGIIPRSIDAIWSRPARTTLDWESARYYVPPIFYGWLLLVALRSRDPRVMIVAIFSMVAFRSAAGRCSWSHTRYGAPLLGLALVAFVLEPLVLRKRWIAAVALTTPIIILVELFPNVIAATKFMAGWRARQGHAGLVRTSDIYTTQQDAKDLAALNGFVSANAPPGASLLDLSNEKALYYLLQRRPATRCFDVAFLSAPPLTREALAQLQRNPPACVIVKGLQAVDFLDGVPNRDRVPWLFAWVDTHYPRRAAVGRFVIATK